MARPAAQASSLGLPFRVLGAGVVVVLGGLLLGRRHRGRRGSRSHWAQSPLSGPLYPEPTAGPQAGPDAVTHASAFPRWLGLAAVVTIAALLALSPPVSRSGPVEPEAASAASPQAAAAAIARVEPRPAGAGLEARSSAVAAAPLPLLPRALSTLEVRLGPAQGYLVLGSLPRGSLLDIVGRDDTGEWLAVVFAPGSKLNGWVHKGDVGNLPDVKLLPVADVTQLQ